MSWGQILRYILVGQRSVSGTETSEEQKCQGTLSPPSGSCRVHILGLCYLVLVGLFLVVALVTVEPHASYIVPKLVPRLILSRPRTLGGIYL